MESPSNGLLNKAAIYNGFVEQIQAMTEYSPEPMTDLLHDIASNSMMGPIDASKLITTIAKQLKLKITDVRSEFDNIKKAIPSRSNHKETSPAVEGNETPLTVSQQAVAKWILAQGVKKELLFDEMSQEFMIYADGVWRTVSKPESMKFINDRIQDYIDANPAAGSGYASTFTKGVRDFLQWELGHNSFNKLNTVAIPLSNGVLWIESRALKPHSPDYYWTWQLPFDHDEKAECPKILEYLKDATASTGEDGSKKPSESRVQTLRAFVRAALTLNMSSYQKYLELYGDPGSGKGTFMRLVEMLIGESNIAAITLAQLENDRHLTVAMRGKRLILIGDADGSIAKMPLFLSMTGGDLIPYNKKNESSFGERTQFRFDGAVIIGTNTALHTANMALMRRKKMVAFPHIPDKQRDLMDEFLRANELPGFLNWVLSMPDEDAKQILMAKDSQAVDGDMLRDAMEALIVSNPIAKWMNECLDYDENAEPTQIGNVVWEDTTPTESPNSRRKVCLNADRYLLASYSEWAHHAVIKSDVNQQNFKDKVMRLCQELRINVRHEKPKNKSCIKGLVISENPRRSPIAVAYKQEVKVSIQSPAATIQVKPNPMETDF